jgi:serine O-acetyltransferase
MFEALRRDRARYAALGAVWYRHPGFWAGAVYRLGSWAGQLPSTALRVPAVLVYRLLKLPWLVLSKVDIPTGVRIGPGLCIVHPSNIIIGRGVEIGDDCTLFHEVTIGSGMTPGMPRIGNGVHLFVGARVLGPLHIGDHSMIGANCVVTANVPERTVVGVAPNRTIPLELFARSTELVARQAGQSASPIGNGPAPAEPGGRST